MQSPRALRWILFPLGFALAACLSAQDVAPEFTLSDLEGATRNLRDYRGKIVVLNFWATWCGPCTEEMPMLVNVQKEYGDRGVMVVGVSLDDSTSRAKVPEFARKKKVNFPIWVGGTTEDLKRLGLGEALPATAFLDPQGRITGRVLGMLRKKDLRHRVEWLLGNHQGDAPKALVNNLGLE
ncbi:MAG: TlpA family protein disulfide reductase [Terriglobia bacterium]